MHYRFLSLLVLLIALNGFAIASDLSDLAITAVTAEKAESEAAISILRQQKQSGLDAVFDTFRQEIADFRTHGRKSDKWNRISRVLDGVAMQKDAYSARLFWHTDLNAAKREAVSQKKLILTLRLLGGLNEEYSCANSRFFRSILYSDPAVARILRENYVLHWKSVRPAPKITIDFGDGRKLVRTITGNSIHYVLSNTGQIIDALPGLYDPETFGKYLTRLRMLAKNGYASSGAANGYRLRTASAIIKDWKRRLSILGKETSIEFPPAIPVIALDSGQPSALDAAPRAVTKAIAERPAVLALMPQIERLRAETEIDDWKPLAKLSNEARFSQESLALIRSKSGDISEKEFSRLIQNLKSYVAIDTVQNEYRFHMKIMSWMNSMSSSNLEGFNRRVYSELFLTPDSDKWLGLYAPDIYSAIENNGLRN